MKTKQQSIPTTYAEIDGEKKQITFLNVCKYTSVTYRHGIGEHKTGFGAVLDLPHTQYCDRASVRDLSENCGLLSGPELRGSALRAAWLATYCRLSRAAAVSAFSCGGGGGGSCMNGAASSIPGAFLGEPTRVRVV